MRQLQLEKVLVLDVQILMEAECLVLLLRKQKIAESIQEKSKRKLVPVGFEHDMCLFGATALGIGVFKGVGIYALIELAAGYAGPAVKIAESSFRFGSREVRSQNPC